jgi:hypothetical protein
MNRLSFILRRLSGLLLVAYLAALALPMSPALSSVVHHPVYRTLLVLAVAHHAFDAAAIAALRRRRALKRRAVVARTVLIVSLVVAVFHLPFILSGPALGGS